MAQFLIKKINIKDYDVLLLFLSTESIFDQLSLIEEDSCIKKASGTILIDQLFLTGNNENRFISCSFKNGKIDFNTAKVVQPNINIRKKIIKWLNNHYQYVENSILTECQKNKIKQCTMI